MISNISTEQVKFFIVRKSVIFDRATGCEFFTRSVCVENEVGFYIHNHIFTSKIGSEKDCFVYPKAQQQAEELISKMKRKGNLDLDSELWESASPSLLTEEQLEIINEESQLHAEHERGWGAYDFEDSPPTLITPNQI
ncbi:hypothetical protein KW882_02300 [Vibrio parahaemolyticus]